MTVIEVPELTDGTLWLRPRALAGVDEYLAEERDPLSQRFSHRPVDEAALRERITNPPADRLNWEARDASGAYLGSVGLASGVHGGDRTNLGWGVAAAARGSGAAARMARLVSDWALLPVGSGGGGFTTIVASVTATNTASRMSALRAGMRPEAVLTHGGEDAEFGGFPDEHVYVRTGPVVPAQPTIGAGDLQLRPWRTRDAPLNRAWAEDPATREFTTVPVPWSLEGATAFLGVGAAEVWAAGTGARFAVWRGTELVGGVDTRRLAPGVWDIGCICHPAARGQSVVPRAVDGLVRELFAGIAQLGPVARVEWHARLDNEASVRAAQKSGFTPEGVRAALLERRDGSRADAWIGVRLP